MHILFNLIILIAALRWGDWRNWEKYYPTILYFIVGDLLYNFIFYQHYYWVYHEKLFPTKIPDHSFIALLFMFICYPGTILIYLKYFFQTNNWVRRALHLLLWIFIYFTAELIFLHVGSITHHNDWHLGWSILFLVVMFGMFPIHHKKPLLAIVLSIIFITFLLLQFDIPLEKLKD